MTEDYMQGWHAGPDGQPVSGFVEGTAFQPNGVQDHLDAWGTPHPGDLRDCRECREGAALPGVGGAQ